MITIQEREIQLIESTKRLDQLCNQYVKQCHSHPTNKDETKQLQGQFIELLNITRRDVESYRIHLGSCSEYERRLYQQKLSVQLNLLRQTVYQFETLELTTTDRSSTTEIKDIDTGTGLIQHGQRLLAEDQQTLQRTLQTVNETKEIGIHVAERVQLQNKQLEDMYADLYEINDEVKRGYLIMKRLFRRVASNKLLWFIIILIMAAILFIIVWRIIH